MSWAVTFLGVGNASAPTLGSASMVLERDARPVLMVDCGQEALTAFTARYRTPPPALFITHVHLDHVAGFERLFVSCLFGPGRHRPRVYVPAAIVSLLHQRVGDYPNALAEGHVNFWDAFELVPVSRGFWHAGAWLDVFPVRHHVPGTAFGLSLAGSLVYTGDTRPIPELLAQHAPAPTRVLHDCDLHGNPSHSGLPDLLREYPPDLLRRLVVYHYGSVADGEALARAGLRVARAGDRLDLPEPLPAEAAHAAAVTRTCAPGLS